MFIYLILFFLIAISLIILFQDYRDRKVHLLLILGFVAGSAILQIQKNILINIFLIESLVNFAVLLLMLTGVFVYFKWIRKMNPSTSIGTGDIIVFLAFVLGYEIMGFAIHFTLALLVSLCLHFLLKSKDVKYKTVPLAGYMVIYFSMQKVFNEFSILIP
jgi:hypothetical protein